jgi:hypothetical protein
MVIPLYPMTNPRMGWLVTNIQWVQEVGPAKYNPTITAATATHTRKQMEEEWDEERAFWYIRKGFLCGVTMNMCNSLDEAYYSQLKHITTAYRNTTPIQGRASTKIIQLPDGTRTAVNTISELPFDIREPANEIQNIPTITKNSLLSIPKTAEAGYITVLDDEEVSIYDA